MPRIYVVQHKCFSMQEYTLKKVRQVGENGCRTFVRFS